MSVKEQRCLMLPALAVVVMAALGGWASAGVVWDGSGDPVAAGFQLNPAATGEPFIFDWCDGQPWTGIAYQNSSAAGSGYYSLPTAASELVRAGGWTVETRVQVKGNTGDKFGLIFGVGDDLGGVGMLLHADVIQVYDTTWASVQATIPIDSDYHDIRIQVAPGGASSDIFVDDMVTPAATITLPNDPGAKFYAGDASSGSAGVAYWDHIVVNAAAPAPTDPPSYQGNGLNIDATFEAGALPSDFGMTAVGSVDPVPNVSGGMWTNTLLATETSCWLSYDLPKEIIGPVIHGFAEVEQATLTGARDDQTVICLSTDLAGSFSFIVSFNNGYMTVVGSSNVTVNEIDVANQDGGKHIYGWELDQDTDTLKLFFNGYQIGEAEGYNVAGNFNGEELMYFGDATSGNDHSEVWDRWLVAEGAYPALVAIPGDANYDGVVNAADAAILASNWQMAEGASWAKGDFNGDGAVNDIDATIMASNWQAAASASVPEPGMAVLLAGMLLGFVLCRRGK